MAVVGCESRGERKEGTKEGLLTCGICEGREEGLFFQRKDFFQVMFPPPKKFKDATSESSAVVDCE